MQIKQKQLALSLFFGLLIMVSAINPAKGVNLDSEPNNNPTQATPLGPPGIFEGNLNHADVDWYHFVPQFPNDNVSIRLNFSHIECNMRLTVFNGTDASQQLGMSDTLTDVEHLVLVKAGGIFIQISATTPPQNSLGANYTLEVIIIVQDTTTTGDPTNTGDLTNTDDLNPFDIPGFQIEYLAVIMFGVVIYLIKSTKKRKI